VLKTDSSGASTRLPQPYQATGSAGPTWEWEAGCVGAVQMHMVQSALSAGLIRAMLSPLLAAGQPLACPALVLRRSLSSQMTSEHCGGPEFRASTTPGPSVAWMEPGGSVTRGVPTCSRKSRGTGHAEPHPYSILDLLGLHTPETGGLPSLRLALT
jgi:hypothetical protein